MVKDIVVNLTGAARRNSRPITRSRSARASGRTSRASAFIYEPVIPDGMLGGIPIDLIEAQREENSREREGRG